MKYNYISKAKKEYIDLLGSGMFFEFYPKLTGDWEQDELDWKSHYKDLSKIRKLYTEFQKLESDDVKDFYVWLQKRNKNLLNIFTWKK